MIILMLEPAEDQDTAPCEQPAAPESQSDEVDKRRELSSGFIGAAYGAVVWGIILAFYGVILFGGMFGPWGVVWGAGLGLWAILPGALFGFILGVILDAIPRHLTGVFYGGIATYVVCAVSPYKEYASFCGGVGCIAGLSVACLVLWERRKAQRRTRTC